MFKYAAIISMLTGVTGIVSEQAPQTAPVTQRIESVATSPDVEAIVKALAAIRQTRQPQPLPQGVT